MSKNNESKLTGNAGEFYVAAELSKKGFNTAILLGNTENYDILTVNSKTQNQILIQVKTSWNARGGRKWVLTKKVEDIIDKNLFYIFVNLFEENKRPEFFIIHSEELSNIIKTGYDRWLKTPGKNGQKHNPNSIRQFSDKEGVYLEQWNKLLEHTN